MCSLHMWIIYRLWGFLLLKPALGVLQIPAQSIATQSSLFCADSLAAPFGPTMKSALLTHGPTLTTPQKKKKKTHQQPKPNDYISFHHDAGKFDLNDKHVKAPVKADVRGLFQKASC